MSQSWYNGKFFQKIYKIRLTIIKRAKIHIFEFPYHVFIAKKFMDQCLYVIFMDQFKYVFLFFRINERNISPRDIDDIFYNAWKQWKVSNIYSR